MDNIGERIEQVLKAVGVKKVEAARRLNVSPAHITKICKGESGVSDRTISDICQEFGVDEVWLRHGEGEMFKSRSWKEDVSAYMGQLLGNQRSEFEEDIIEFMANTRPEFWDILIEEMRPLAKRIVEKKPPDTE